MASISIILLHFLQRIEIFQFSVPNTLQIFLGVSWAARGVMLSEEPVT